jgi:hypothetical protein
MECALEKVKQDKEKKARKADKIQRIADKTRLIELKPLKYWLDIAQSDANKYARLRDHDKGCASCDRPQNWHGQWHGSHFRSVKAASAIRFNLWNIHKACSICNNWESSNREGYEPRLRAKIGNEKVDWLLSQNQTRIYTVEYLQRFIKIFRKKIKRIERRINS